VEIDAFINEKEVLVSLHLDNLTLSFPLPRRHSHMATQILQ
jgi:hypothetical protein